MFWNKKFAVAAMMGAISALTLGGEAVAQEKPIIYQPTPDSPIGKRNVKGPAALAEFDFVIGDWDVVITWTPPNAEPLTYKAKWHNHWIVDGLVVMQEWRGPYLTGTEIRSWDRRQKKWTGRNVYVNGIWHETTAEFKDGKMIVIIENAEDRNGPFKNRETYHEITDDSFKMYSDRSYDGGQTWETGRYSMVVTRTIK